MSTPSWIRVFEVSQADRAAFDAIGAEHAASETSDHAYASRVRDAKPDLSADFDGALRSVIDPEQDQPVLVLRFGDTGHLPPTPGGHDANPTLLASDARQLGLFVGTADPYGYRKQQHGRLLNDIVPMAHLGEVADISAGFRHEFRLHTEDAFHGCRPDIFTLRCLRNGTSGAPTDLAFVGAAEIDADLRTALAASSYRHASNSGQAGGIPRRSEPAPVLWGPGLGFVRANLCQPQPPAAEGADPDAADAYHRFVEAIEAVRHPVDLQPGDLLVVDNRRVLHARRPYDPAFSSEGGPRWLRRTVYSMALDEWRDEGAVTGAENIVEVDHG